MLSTQWSCDMKKTWFFQQISLEKIDLPTLKKKENSLMMKFSIELYLFLNDYFDISNLQNSISELGMADEN